MKKQPEKSSAREITETLIEGGVGMVPVVGSPLAAAFALAMGWSYNRRMNEWLDELAEAVNRLGQRFEDLAGDEVFVDAVVNASRAAQATHQQEKLDALCNGVVNSVGPEAPSADEQARFFRLVEQFSPAHLRLLGFLHDPGAAFDNAGLPRPELLMGGRGNLLEQALPEFAGRRTWYDLLMADLTAAQLTQGGLHTTMSGSGLWQPATTDLGARYLRFITDQGEDLGAPTEGVGV